MKSILAVTIGLGLLAGTATQAHAIGCLSGAAAGGVAGHVAGHHGVLGAVAGCAVGHHMAVRRNRERAAQQRQEFNDAPPSQR